MTTASICITLYVLGWFTTSWLWLRYMTHRMIRDGWPEICESLFIDVFIWWVRLPIVLFSLTLRGKRD